MGKQLHTGRDGSGGQLQQRRGERGGRTFAATRPLRRFRVPSKAQGAGGASMQVHACTAWCRIMGHSGAARGGHSGGVCGARGPVPSLISTVHACHVGVVLLSLLFLDRPSSPLLADSPPTTAAAAALVPVPVVRVRRVKATATATATRASSATARNRPCSGRTPHHPRHATTTTTR